MFKELEKIRQEYKKEYFEFKQLSARQALGASSEDDLEDEDEEARPLSAQAKGQVSWAVKLASSSRAQSPERPAAADLQGAPPSARRRPVKPQPFRPREFYLRSSAFLRHRPQKEAPAICPQVGTARPAILMRPRSRQRKLHVKPRREPVSRPKIVLSPEHEDPGLEVARPRYRLASSLSSLGSEVDDSGRLRRLRIHTHFMREGMGASRWLRPRSKSGREGGSTIQANWSMPVTRYIPTSIEEIIASLQSEAQLAADQTIKELIQSILGQNYDLTLEVAQHLLLLMPLFVLCPESFQHPHCISQSVIRGQRCSGIPLDEPECPPVVTRCSGIPTG
ncbi:tetratricopeptide repeat domain 6 [Cricetulus griseus]